MEALNIANLNNISLPTEIKRDIINKKIGFTVIKGMRPKGIKDKIKVDKIIQKLINYPQAQNILLRSNISVIYNDATLCEVIRPEDIKPMAEFEEPVVIEIPKKLAIKDDGESVDIYLSNKKYPAGFLILKTSEMAFTRNSAYENLNRIDFISNDIGVVATYKIYEIGVRTFP